MSENHKNNHETVGGDVFGTSSHKHCGREDAVVRAVEQNSHGEYPIYGRMHGSAS